MNYIILKRIDKNDYWPIKKNKISNLYNLWSLFNSTASPEILLKEWILDPSQEVLSTNNCYLRKEGNNVVVSELCGSDDENDAYAITVPNQQLCALVDEWYKLCQADVEKIIIWSVGDDFTISEYLEPEELSTNNDPRKNSYSSIS